ncbi:ANTAR domain-containing protein [Streptomyces fructofermentans]|uniref:GAF domain-containing protein n=1 Tax=Streptomyces fructofermentans TaxID=152141 RepID=A0A918NMP6_9ACTN|nr:ANTAR domain-containing protein [Streptomyces fructofermentans]GGX81374.1 GAF domain-containing protein [Streptomyces fructofermentans]
MISDRMAEILRRLQTNDWSDAVADAAEPLGVDGISVSAGSGTGVTEILWSSGGISDGFEDLQATLGQGPGPDSLAAGTAVRVPDLTRVLEDRWPALVTEASVLSVGAVFCFPLRIGAITLGVLTLVRSACGPLTAGQGDDANALAAVLTKRVLDLGFPLLSAPEEESLPYHHAVLHQATGMVSAQLSVSLAEALLRLRAHAYSNSLNLTDTARDIVARRLRLAPEPPPMNVIDDADED